MYVVQSQEDLTVRDKVLNPGLGGLEAGGRRKGRWPGEGAGGTVTDQFINHPVNIPGLAISVYTQTPALWC